MAAGFSVSFLRFGSCSQRPLPLHRERPKPRQKPERRSTGEAPGNFEDFCCGLMVIGASLSPTDQS